MAVDLYKDDFSRLHDAEVLQAIEAFTRISEPIQVRPRESFVLDFKKEWNDRALCTVAAFAHTFGGLLLVGVSEKDAQPDELVGVESAGELKTSIASAIATNISPPPSYEIAECSLPTVLARRLAVIRVRQGNQIHYLTKKGEKPIYVRNEDESVPADAARLRSLIERRSSPSQSLAEINNRISAMRPSVQLFEKEGPRTRRAMTKIVTLSSY
jgi:predicted HTH transcriptional regulator